MRHSIGPFSLLRWHTSLSKFVIIGGCELSYLIDKNLNEKVYVEQPDKVHPDFVYDPNEKSFTRSNSKQLQRDWMLFARIGLEYEIAFENFKIIPTLHYCRSLQPMVPLYSWETQGIVLGVNFRVSHYLWNKVE